MYSWVVPKVADPAVRIALIEHAARITAEEGRQALTLRRLANEVGASTMAIYTHFGGMDDLRRAVRREGFDRLREHLDVGVSADPVADLLAQGAAYFLNALTNRNLYRAMFMDQPLDDDDVDDEGVPIGLDTFEMLVDVVTRCIEAGRFDPAEPVSLANQVWAMSHGVVTLFLAGLLSDEVAVDCLTAGARNLFLAFGDSPAALDRSRLQAERR
jgi:AcrR family transcriptional regulator